MSELKSYTDLELIAELDRRRKKLNKGKAANRLCEWGFHNWILWSDPIPFTILGVTRYLIQRRFCSVCGKLEERHV